jgi:hypothetical protein
MSIMEKEQVETQPFLNVQLSAAIIAIFFSISQPAVVGVN